MDDIVKRLREHLIRRDTRVSTHWDGCIYDHPLCALAWALDEIERLRQLNIQLADAVHQWQQFMKEYWPSLMCPPGTSAMRNWQEYFDQRKQHVNNNNHTTGSVGL